MLHELPRNKILVLQSAAGVLHRTFRLRLAVKQQIGNLFRGGPFASMMENLGSMSFKNSQLYFRLFLAALALTTIGCGSDLLELVEVTGTVTLDGKPLPDAEVIFQPADGRPSSGRTDTEGRYTLQYMDDKSGALPGMHSVRVSTYIERDQDHWDPSVQAGRKEMLPQTYNSRTTLTADLKPHESNVVDFSLNSTSVATR
jgi:hypothetical protein